MSGALAVANPRRIKAAHRRRRKVASGPIVQRYYDPIIGRFLSVDPVTADGNTGANFNRYKYAANNPYRFTDPDGRLDKERKDIERVDRRSILAKSPGSAGQMATSARSASASGSSRSNASTQTQGKTAAAGDRPKPSISATGVAALGVGFEASKGLKNAGDTISLVTPALGLEAKIDGELPFAQFNFVPNPVDTPVTMSFSVSAHFIGGIGLKGTVDPGGTAQLSLTGGVGLGASLQLYSIGAEVRKPGE